jgi:hypothetical protein
MGGGGSTNPYSTARGAAAAADPKGNVKPRFEFIVVFVWKEPTPSDKLLSDAPATSTSTTPGVTGP